MITRISFFSPIPNAHQLITKTFHLLSCYKFCYNSKGVYTNLSPNVKKKMNGCIYFLGHAGLGYRNGAVALFLGPTTSNTPFCH